MSVEEKEIEAVEAEIEEDEITEKEPVKKKKFFSKNRIEIIVAIFLGITALLTAWATWIGSLHGGNQATNYTKSNNYATEGNSAYNSGMQTYISDLTIWNTAIDYQLDANIARMNGNEEEAKIYEDKRQALVMQSGSEILINGILQMEDGMTSPYEIEGLKEQYFAESEELYAESKRLLEEGQRDNANGDAYNLVNVIYSVVLFLLGIVGVFKSLPNRAVVLVIAIIGVVLATIYMFTIPLPTGFNFLSFFGIG